MDDIAKTFEDIWGELRLMNRLKTLELEARAEVIHRTDPDRAQSLQKEIDDAWSWSGGAR
jgi:hypothetical protein